MYVLFTALCFISQGWTEDVPQVQRDAPAEVMPSRTWDFTHLHLDVTLDPPSGTISGTATHSIAPLSPHHRTVRMHQNHLEIEKVWVDGALNKDFRVSEGFIDIAVPPNENHEIMIQYTAQPETGLHFRQPKGSVDTIEEIWSQGEAEDNRHWFPGWDYPNDRFTYSAAYTVPKHLHVVSNGQLQKTKTHSDGTKTWTYALEHELVNYLVMLAAGEYTVYHDEGVVPLEYIVPNTVSKEIVLKSFGAAKPQLDYFNVLLGEDYPYSIYRQVAVQRFMYGGMENTTSTIMSDDLLRRLPSDTPYRSESVTAHELAHQWFGDWLTCYGWRELWLNEGFASYYAMRWMETQYGNEYYAVTLHRSLRSARSGSAPMSPIGLTKKGRSENAAVYTQGLSVLHGLSQYLGRDVFDTAIQEYVQRHKNRLVETTDLRRVLEDVSGQHLGWFFDQWVTGRGTPSFTTGYSYVASTEKAPGTLTITIEQTTEESTFHAPVHIEIGDATGIKQRTVWVHDGKTELVLEMDAAPKWVVVDPNGALIAKWTRESKASNWEQVLIHSPSPYARLIALTQFSEKKNTKETVTLLEKALNDSGMYVGLREYAARALGRIATNDAQEALLSATSHSDATIRRFSLSALAKLPSSETTVKALSRAVKRDVDPNVQREALSALAALSGSKASVFSRLALAKPATRARTPLMQESLSVLGQHGTIDDIAIMVPFAKAKHYRSLRQGMMWAMTRLLGRLDTKEAKPQYSVVSSAIVPALDDPDIRIRQTAIQVLGYVGDKEVEKRLRAFAAQTHISSHRDDALDSANWIRNRKPKATEQDKKTDLTRLEEKVEEMEQRLKDVERWR